MSGSDDSGVDRPPLSIVVGTREGWPYVRPVLEAVRGDAEAMGAEIVFADGSGMQPPPPDEVGPQVRWLSLDEPSVFRLYSRGISSARGDIIATTEDHAVPRPGWCTAIVRAHAEHPEAAAIGGAIENGSHESLIDWASYFITQGPHMAPQGNRRVAVTTNEADVSYKRHALVDLDDNGGLGFMAILHNRRLAERGAILRVDDRMAVDHYQTIGFGATSAIHFHNGRAISGFRRHNGMAATEWLRLLALPLLPLWRTARTIRLGLSKGRHRRVLLASAPLALWLDYCQAAGHALGYLAGPGKSPDHLR